MRDRLWNHVLKETEAAPTLEQRLAAVRVAWESGELTGLEVTGLHCEAAVVDGFDRTLELLDQPWRDELFDWLKGWALADPSERPVRIFGGIYAHEREADPQKAAQMRKEISDTHDAEDHHFMTVTRPAILAWWRDRSG